MNQLNESIAAPRRRPRLVCVFAGDEFGDCIARMYSRSHGRRRMRVLVRRMALSTGARRGDFRIGAFVVPEGHRVAAAFDAALAAERIAQTTDHQGTRHEPTE